MSAQSQPVSTPANTFLRGSIRSVFIRTSLPIIFVTMINGLLVVADAMLLGTFVGADALGAVTLVFPISMLLVAFSTMVGIGMASILGRQLGARDIAGANTTLASAQGLALALAALTMAVFFALGGQTVHWLAHGDAHLEQMGWTFLAISFVTAPAGFLLSVQADALRTEGRVGFMAITGIAVTLANIGLNAMLIGLFDFGVAGSAWGTALAQLLGLSIAIVYRVRGKAVLPMVGARYHRIWTEILSLGAPRSLNFIGISLSSAAVLFALQRLDLAQPEATIAAYGVVMRLMTFAFLPLMGMSLALQAIVGNTVGAGHIDRATRTLYLSLAVSVVYGLLVQAVLIGGRNLLGGLFVADALVGAEVARIVSIYLAAYFAFGPIMMLASHAQATGRVRQAAILSLGRAYLFAIPLTLCLPLVWGETGIWITAPLADVSMLTLGLLIWSRARIAPVPAGAPATP